MKRMIINLKSLRHKIYLGYCHTKPIRCNKILLWADNFKSFGCSPKYIALYLVKRYPKKYDIVWVLNNEIPVPSDLPDEIRIVRYFSMEYLKEISTAKFIICNSRIGAGQFFNKRKGQVYIQTWHSSLRLKMIESDAANILSDSYIKNAKKDSAKIDLLLSGCDFSTRIFKRAFWYSGEILDSGTPRCDIFFRNTNDVKDRVFKTYGIPSNCRLAIYAPTFRDQKQTDLHGMDFDMLQSALERKTGTPWRVGCRLHPNFNVSVSDQNCISMTDHPDMQELLAAADCLITDYSSCMFDMAIAKKPCFLYVPDLKHYVSKERGLYFDIDSLPFSKSESMYRLCESIGSFDIENYLKDIAILLQNVGSYENGTAAKRVAEYIEKMIRG